MDFATEYPRLEPVQQERFRAVVTRLLSGEVLTSGTALRPDPDWRFAERHRELLDAYLRIGGWRLDTDLGLRLCRAIHEGGEQRVRLGKLESLVLCTLRLVYHEEMQRMSEEARCEIRVGDLRERLIQSGRPAAQLSRRALADAVRRLARHSLVAVERGFAGEDTEAIVVQPLIERVLPPDRIAEMAERVRLYARAAAAADTEPGGEGVDAAGTDGGSGDETGEEETA